MKILYGIQGTGHGHISRAREILPLLSGAAEVDVLLSGYNCHMSIDDVTLIRKRGISLSYSNNGRVSLLETIKNLKPITFLRDVRHLQPESYNLVISDYEPVSAWAAYKSGVPSLALSHQAAFKSEFSPRPARQSYLAEQVLKKFAPCQSALGFHFRRYDSFIEPPIIRSEVLNLKPETGNHVTVYLPAYHHKNLIPHFKKVPHTNWHLFSQTCSKAFKDGNVNINPVNNAQFLNSLETCRGVLTSGGFETCAEAMYLGKKLMVIPIQNQYEQLCNAAALRELGITITAKVNNRFPEIADDWLHRAPVRWLKEISDTSLLRDTILSHANNSSEQPRVRSLFSLQPVNTSLQ
ncbi:MAG: glycosyltransferase family protein [Rhodohalobacter sp.]|uniref:glycosyltransferase family protein n=1 Tax=Rhodohalobacter sp. TaxID=1974210 RepID=UPI003975B6BA